MKTTIQKKSLAISLAAAFLIAIVLAFTSFWQGAIIAGLGAGLFNRNRKGGALFGFLGVSAAWLLYAVVKGKWLLLDQVGQIIIGDGGFGFALVVIMLVCGGILGALGGVVGSSLRDFSSV